MKHNIKEMKSSKKRNIYTQSGNYTERLGGNYIQGDFVNYIVIPNEQRGTLIDDPPTVENQRVLFPQGQDKLVAGNLVYDEHKFHGKLAIIGIELYQINQPNNFCIKLTIAFGTLEVKIPRTPENLNCENETIDIQMGIKRSKLCFDLENGIMQLENRNPFVNQENGWKAIHVGEPQSPEWQFELMNKSQILLGNLTNESLGILEFSEPNAYCNVTASLEISINSCYIEIIDFDDGSNNKQQKATKNGLLFKFLKNELGITDNKVSLSKVAKTYDPETIS